MRGARIATGIFCASLAAGCTTVPPLDVDDIAVADIVQRVKCEIAYAVPEPQGRYPTGPYQWMRDWTAKVDLNLITNAQASITPTAVFTNLLPTVAVPNVGNVGQMFTFGLGAGASTTAQRSEIMSFTISLSELRKFKYRDQCYLPESLHLYGNLGLNEWVHSALAPVKFGQLAVGWHPPPGGKSIPAPPPSEKLKAEEGRALACDVALVQPVQDARDAAIHYATMAQDYADKAENHSKQRNVQATYDDASTVVEAVKQTNVAVKKATKAADKADKTCPDDPAVDKLLKRATKAGDDAAAAKKVVDALLEALPHDPPVDSLSHSVQFIVALSANATPNWTLVRFKGPGATPPLASATGSTTHTLTIAMGSPAVAGAPPSASAEQIRQLNNQLIINNLGPTSRLVQ
jgi:hypothetical protein